MSANRIPPRKKVPPRKKEVILKGELVGASDGPKGSFGLKKSEVLINQILSEIEEGLNMNTACMLHDLDVTSWSRWRRCKDLQPEGLTELGMEKTVEDRRCQKCQACLLQKRCDKARLKYVKRHHRRIAEANIDGVPMWTASAWLLERTDPETYANKTKQEITHSINVGTNNAQRLVTSIIGATQIEQPEAD